MRSRYGFSRWLAAALVVAALSLMSPPALNAEGVTFWWWPPVAGTWVWWSELQPGVRVPTLVTYHSDGLVTASDVLTFGGLPNVPYRITPLNGVWAATGRNTFATTSLFLVYNASSSLLIGFGRCRASMSFADNDSDQISGTLYCELLSCPSPVACPDPQSANATWVPIPGFPASAPATAARLRRVPPGPLP